MWKSVNFSFNLWFIFFIIVFWTIFKLIIINRLNCIPHDLTCILIKLRRVLFKHVCFFLSLLFNHLSLSMLNILLIIRSFIWTTWRSCHLLTLTSSPCYVWRSSIILFSLINFIIQIWSSTYIRGSKMRLLWFILVKSRSHLLLSCTRLCISHQIVLTSFLTEIHLEFLNAS